MVKNFQTKVKTVKTRGGEERKILPMTSFKDDPFTFMPFFAATYGVSSKEQKKIVREFLKYTYKVNVDQIQTAVMNEYIDYRLLNKLTFSSVMLFLHF
jgi:hypothetical protein